MSFETHKTELPQRGARIGEHTIEKILGEGGYGVVYLARHERLRRDVALKVLLPAALAHSKDAPERFLREIDLVCRLEHPHVVRLYDCGQQGELLWMSMEFVRGESLFDALRTRGPFSFERSRKLTLQILSGLIEAHEQQIIHRDLKPANVMLTRKGPDPDFVKILDFGIGKALADAEQGRPQEDLTDASNESLGTPRYMAPEQIAGQNVGPHSDVYSVGLILYEMLLGRPAVTGENSYQILANQITSSIDIPAVLKHSPLGPILERAVEKEWHRRYPDASAFYNDLAALSDDALHEVSLHAALPEPIAESSGPAVSTPTASPRLFESNTSRRVLLDAPPEPTVVDADDDTLAALEAAALSLDSGPQPRTGKHPNTDASTPPNVEAVTPAGEEGSSRMGLIAGVIALLLTVLITLVVLYTRGGDEATPEEPETSERVEVATPATTAAAATTAPEGTSANTPDVLEAKPSGETTASATSATEGEIAEPLPVETAQPRSVTVRFEGMSGVEVFRGSERVGKTPFTTQIELAEGSEPVRFTFERDRYRDGSYTLAADASGEVVVPIELRKRKSSSSSSSKDEGKTDDGGGKPSGLGIKTER